MNWINIKDKSPSCDSQHGNVFSSGMLLTYDCNGEYKINEYLECGEHTGNGWVKLSEGFIEDDDIITHWSPLVSP